MINQLAHFRAFADQRVAMGGRGRIAAWCEREGMPFCQVQLGLKAQIPFGFFGLVRAIRAFRPDIVILHGQWAGPIGAVAARLSRVPRIVYIARWPAFYTSWDLFRSVRNHLAEWVPCHLAHTVVFLSMGNRYQYLLRRLVERAKTVLLPNAFDPSRLPSVEAVELARKSRPATGALVHVVSISRLTTQKRVDWLLHSWAQLGADTARAHLWILGDGPERMKLEQLAERLKIADSITFLGSRDDAIAHIAASDIVVMTSLYEGHSNVPLEAMACRRPLVSSDVDGIRESYLDGDEGFLIPPGDTGLFADRLSQLIRDPDLRARMGERGRLRAALFAPEIVYARYRQLLDA